MSAGAVAKNLVIAVVAGVAAMLIYDTIKKRAAAQPVVPAVNANPKTIFAGGITVETPVYAQAPARDVAVGPEKPVWT